MSFIKKWKLPKNRFIEVTYGRLVCDVRECIAEKNRTILIVGEDRIKHPGNCGTPTAHLLTVKFLLSSVISTLGSKSMMIDINLLPEHTTGAIWINTDETKQFSRGLHKVIWSQWKGNKGWVGIHWNKKRNVWITASRTTSKTMTRIATIKTWIYTKKTHPGIMETQMAQIFFTLVVNNFGEKHQCK